MSNVHGKLYASMSLLEFFSEFPRGRGGVLLSQGYPNYTNGNHKSATEMFKKYC